jgi:hypothetical protein
VVKVTKMRPAGRSGLIIHENSRRMLGKVKQSLPAGLSAPGKAGSNLLHAIGGPLLALIRGHLRDRLVAID